MTPRLRVEGVGMIVALPIRRDFKGGLGRYLELIRRSSVLSCFNFSLLFTIQLSMSFKGGKRYPARSVVRFPGFPLTVNFTYGRT